MTVITGLLIQSEFNTTVAVGDLEVIIDSAIDTVNSDAGTSIGYMTGVTPTKTITVTGDQAAAIKPLIAMKIVSRSIEGASSSNITMGGVSSSSSTSSGMNDVNAELYEKAINRLRGRSFERV